MASTTEKHIYPRQMEKTEPTKQIKADAWIFFTNYPQSLSSIIYVEVNLQAGYIM